MSGATCGVTSGEAGPGCRHSALKTRVNSLKAHPGYRRCRSKIRLGRCGKREQVVFEAIVVVLGADKLVPHALLLAPARCHVHGLVERVFVLDLDQGVEVFSSL